MQPERLLEDLHSLYQQGKYSLFFQRLAHHSINDRSALQATLENSSITSLSSSLPLLFAHALRRSIPFLDPALDQTLSSFFTTSTAFFSDDDFILTRLGGLSRSSSSPALQSSSLALPTSLLELILCPASTFRLRRYAFHFLFSLIQHPGYLSALVRTFLAIESGKEKEQSREEDFLRQQLHELFSALFTQQLATAELQEGVGEVAWRWIRMVEKEQKRQCRSEARLKKGFFLKKEEGERYLLKGILPAEIWLLCERERNYETYLRKLSSTLDDANKKRRKERIAKGLKGEGGERLEEGGWVLPLRPHRVCVTHGNIESVLLSREEEKKCAPVPLSTLLEQRGKIHWGQAEVRMSFFPHNGPAQRAEEEKARDRKGKDEEEAGEEKEETDIFLAYSKLKRVHFLPSSVSTSLRPTMTFSYDDVPIRNALLGPFPPSCLSSLPPHLFSSSSVGYFASDRSISRVERRGSGNERERDTGRVSFTVEFRSQRKMEDLRVFLNGKLRKHQLEDADFEKGNEKTRSHPEAEDGELLEMLDEKEKKEKENTEESNSDQKGSKGEAKGGSAARRENGGAWSPEATRFMKASVASTHAMLLYLTRGGRGGADEGRVGGKECGKDSGKKSILSVRDLMEEATQAEDEEWKIDEFEKERRNGGECRTERKQVARPLKPLFKNHVAHTSEEWRERGKAGGKHGMRAGHDTSSVLATEALDVFAGLGAERKKKRYNSQDVAEEMRDTSQEHDTEEARKQPTTEGRHDNVLRRKEGRCRKNGARNLLILPSGWEDGSEGGRKTNGGIKAKVSNKCVELEHFPADRGRQKQTKRGSENNEKIRKHVERIKIDKKIDGKGENVTSRGEELSKDEVEGKLTRQVERVNSEGSEAEEHKKTQLKRRCEDHKSGKDRKFSPKKVKQALETITKDEAELEEGISGEAKVAEKQDGRNDSVARARRRVSTGSSNSLAPRPVKVCKHGTSPQQTAHAGPYNLPGPVNSQEAGKMKKFEYSAAPVLLKARAIEAFAACERLQVALEAWKEVGESVLACLD